MMVEVHGCEHHEAEKGDARATPERPKTLPALEHDDERVGDVVQRARRDAVPGAEEEAPAPPYKKEKPE